MNGRTWVRSRGGPWPHDYRGAMLRIQVDGDRHVTLFANGRVTEWSLEERTENESISWEGWEEFG